MVKTAQNITWSKQHKTALGQNSTKHHLVKTAQNLTWSKQTALGQNSTKHHLVKTAQNSTWSKQHKTALGQNSTKHHLVKTAQNSTWSKQHKTALGQNSMCETKLVYVWLLFMSRGPKTPSGARFPAIALLGGLAPPLVRHPTPHSRISSIGKINYIRIF